MKRTQIESAWHGAARCKNCAIRHLVLFADVKQEVFDHMHLPIDDIEYQPGHRIYLQGDILPFAYTIRSGMIKLVQRLPNGDTRIVRILGQGDLAGLESLDGSAMDHDAISMDHVKVCRIPKSVIEMLKRDSPEIHSALLQRWQKALTSANNWITRLSTGTSKARVARLLMLLHETSEDDSFFLPVREDMGDMLGLTTESVSKATAEFKRQGLLIEVHKQRACINKDTLHKMFCE